MSAQLTSLHCLKVVSSNCILLLVHFLSKTYFFALKSLISILMNVLRHSIALISQINTISILHKSFRYLYFLCELRSPGSLIGGSVTYKYPPLAPFGRLGLLGIKVYLISSQILQYLYVKSKLNTV